MYVVIKDKGKLQDNQDKKEVSLLWDLWWTEWQVDTFISGSFSFPMSVSFHQYSIYIHIYSSYHQRQLNLGNWLHPKITVISLTIRT
jgi:hypothetical protein